MFQILAVDGQYREDKTGTIAGVLFDSWGSSIAQSEISLQVSNVAAYEAGAFFKRELPCIIELVSRIKTPLSTIIVDGYVDLGEGRPGLGRHLFNYLGGSIPVVGVAKRPFVGASSYEVYRGRSKKPLYVTVAGCAGPDTATYVSNMYGPYRIPSMLRRADYLARCAPPHPSEPLRIE